LLMKAIQKPDSSSLALIELDDERAREEFKKFSWFYQQYAWLNLKFKNTYPELYSRPWIEIPNELIFRIPENWIGRIRWDDDAYTLYEGSVNLHKSIVLIKNMDMDYIQRVIRSAGLNPDKFKRPFRDHQLQALALYLERGNAANFGEMRTGKTPPTIIYIWWLICTGKIDCALIIVPANIKYLWFEELAKDLPDYVQSLTNIIEGNKSQKIVLWNEPKLFYLANYEAVRADIESVLIAFKDKRIALVGDECHRIKNTEALQTQAVKRIPRKYTILLSGTPVANKPQDVFEPTQMIAPNLMGFSLDHFKKTWAWTNSYDEVDSYKSGALDEIHNRLAVISVRALRKNVHLDLGKIIQPQILEMPDKLKKLYEDATTNFVLELESASDKSRLFISSFLARLVRLQQLTDGYLPHLDAKTGAILEYIWLEDKFGIANPKIKFLDEWISEYLYNGTKLVVYSKFVPVLQRLYQRYQKHGARLIYGQTSPEDVMKYQDDFKSDPNCRIMICNTVTTEGKDFCPCNFIIFFDRVWSLKDNIQAEDRVVGINQKQESTVMPLVLKGTIDYNLEFTVLPEKRKNADKVQDGVQTEESSSYSVDDLFALLK
jgi:SNF2 family DNA or RNA helicase